MYRGRTARLAGRATGAGLRHRDSAAARDAKGVMFVSLEDETGSVQVIVRPKVKAQLRGPLLRSKLMAVEGTWRRDGVCAT